MNGTEQTNKTNMSSAHGLRTFVRDFGEKKIRDFLKIQMSTGELTFFPAGISIMLLDRKPMTTT